MHLRQFIRRALPLILTSVILLSVSCPPILVQSVKEGVALWASGSAGGLGSTQFSDFILNSFTGGYTGST